MNKTEAKFALENGQRLTHKYFIRDEWVQGMPDGSYLFEDGVVCSPEEFWRFRPDDLGFADGWEVTEDDQKDLDMFAEVRDMLISGKVVLGGCTDAMLHFSDALAQGLPTEYQIHNLRVGCDYHDTTPIGCDNMKKPACFHKESWKRR